MFVVDLEEGKIISDEKKLSRGFARRIHMEIAEQI